MTSDLVVVDRAYMMFAVELARFAADLGERPFGCVIRDPLGLYGVTASGSESPTDPTRHSEMEAIRKACDFNGGPLKGWTLYSTHEPCLMCTGAIFHSKISRVVWGSSRIDLPDLFRELPDTRWRMTSVPPEIVPGVLHNECIRLFAAERSEMANERAGF